MGRVTRWHLFESNHCVFILVQFVYIAQNSNYTKVNIQIIKVKAGGLDRHHDKRYPESNLNQSGEKPGDISSLILWVFLENFTTHSQFNLQISLDSTFAQLKRFTPLFNHLSSPKHQFLIF